MKGNKVGALGSTGWLLLQYSATYPCAVEPANPVSSGRDWARLPSSLSSVLRPSGACQYHLGIFNKCIHAHTYRYTNTYSKQTHKFRQMNMHTEVYIKKFTHTHTNHSRIQIDTKKYKRGHIKMKKTEESVY